MQPSVPFHPVHASERSASVEKEHADPDSYLQVGFHLFSKAASGSNTCLSLSLISVPFHSLQDYIHRVGRTARAGRSGRAVSVVTQYDVELFQRIEQLIGQKMEQFPAEQEEVLLLVERVSEAQRIATMVSRCLGLFTVLIAES